MNATGDLGIVIPTYVFATPVLGGQFSLGALLSYGRVSTSLSGTLTGTLTTPGGSIPFNRFDSISDLGVGVRGYTPDGFAAMGTLAFTTTWAHLTGDIPVGAYDSARLSNIGLGHGAIDAGGGYTYFDPQTGRELSAVLGFTYNFLNQSTQYRNGVDMHLDWGMSQFFTSSLWPALSATFIRRSVATAALAIGWVASSPK